MKRFGNSFLYFYLCTFLLWSASTQDSSAQISRDSLSNIASQASSEDKQEVLESIAYLQANFEKLKDTLEERYVASLHEHMANGYLKLGDYTNSESSATAGLKIVSANSDDWSKRAVVRFKNILGLLLRRQELFEESELLYKEALQFYASTNDSIIIISNLANLYSEMGQFDSSIAMYDLGFKVLPRVDNIEFNKAKLLDNLGNTKSKNNPKTGLNELLQGLEIRKELSSPEKLFSSYRHLYMHYKRNSNNDLALKYAKQALTISERIPDKSYEKEALGMMINLDQLGFGKKYKRISDSIDSSDQEAENKYALLRFNKENSEEKRREAEFREAQQRKKNVFLILTLVIVVLLVILLFVLSSQRYKKKRAKTITDTEQRIATDIHDGIANDLFLIMNKVELGKTSKEQVLDDLELIYDKTRDISKANVPIELDRPYYEILDDLMLPFRTERRQVITKNVSKINWNRLSKSKKQALYKVLQELLTNSKKYSQASLILIEFTYKSSKVNVIYKDNGIGTNNKERSGLTHAENRIRALKGNITFESSPNKGFNARIDL